MKRIVRNSPLGIIVLLLGAAVIIAGILTMALYHDMSWQSYVIIGCLMLASLWAMLAMPVTEKLEEVPEPVRNRQE